MASLEEVLDALRDLKTSSKVVRASQVLAAAGDYGAEDVLSGSTTAGVAFFFAGMSKKDGGSGEIDRATVFCSTTALTPRITLFLFNQLPTSNLNDNAANTGPSVADHPNFKGQIDFPALEDLGGGSTAVISSSTVGGLPLVYECVTRALYGIAVTRDAITGEAAGMVLSFELQTRLER